MILTATEATQEALITSEFIWFAFTSSIGLIIWIWKDRRKMQDSKNEKIDNLELKLTKTIDEKIKDYDKVNERNQKLSYEKYEVVIESVTETIHSFEEAVKSVGDVVKELSRDVTRLQETTKHIDRSLDKNGRSTEKAEREANEAHISARSAHKRITEINEKLDAHLRDHGLK